MKISCSLFVMLIWSLSAQSQVPTWSEDISQMVYDNCSKCHHDGTAAPFTLLSYEDAVANSLDMFFNMNSGWMPPWPADTEYRHFVGEPTITDEQIDDFLIWIENGHPYGDPDLEPEAPTYPEGSLLDHIDFVAEIEPYTLQYNTDETRWFVIPTNFAETKYINAIEVFAGLDLVHHADISIDNTSYSANLDAQDPLPGFNGSTGWPNFSWYMNAWQPGAGPAQYPEGWGIPLNPGANLVIEIHYGPGGAEETDNTYMNLQFVEDPENVRPINVGWLLGPSDMTDGPLVLLPNVSMMYHQEDVPFWTDKSLISICPHQHLIGSTYKVWMETPEGETVPLVYVDNWDFHWQFYYTYPTLQKIPGGSVIYAEATWDNSATSPYQPNDPPEVIEYGPNTTDEMMFTYFIYAAYEEGDEFISMDPGTEVVEIPESDEWRIFPNPASSTLSILRMNKKSDLGMVEVIDNLGKVVSRQVPENTGAYLSVDIQDLPAGSYILVWNNQNGRSSQEFIKVE